MKYLASKKLALALIIVLAVLAIIGMTIPQDKPGVDDYSLWKSRHAQISPVIEALQLNRIFSSWWIKIVYVLFFINIFTCTILQAKRLLPKGQNNSKGTKYIEIQLTGSSKPGEIISRYLTKHGYRVSVSTVETGNQFIAGEKNIFSKWSLVVFHVGLLVIVSGILFSVLSRSDGIIPVMEGQEVTEDKENYVLLTRGVLSPGHSKLPIKMKKISLDIDQQKKTIKSITDVVQFGSETFPLDSQNPAQSQGFTIYRDKFGYTLNISFTGNAGAAKNLTFPLLMDSRQHTVYSNEINLPGTSYVLTATLYPNAVKNINNPKQQYYSVGTAPVNPVVYLAVKDSAGKEIANSYMKKNGSLRFDGNKLQLNGIGNWCSLRFVRDSGVAVIYAGFLICILGLVMLYLFIPKVIYARINKDGTVEIGGKAGHYKNLFKDELNDLAVFLTNGGD